jgi:integrase
MDALTSPIQSVLASLVLDMDCWLPAPTQPPNPRNPLSFTVEITKIASEERQSAQAWSPASTKIAASVSRTPAVTATAADAIVSPATSLPMRAGGVVPRRRFQKGSMVTRGTRNPQRCGIYREDVLSEDGTLRRIRRTVRLGPESKLSERAGWAKFQPYLDRVNAAVQMPPKSGMTLEAFVQEWRSNVAANLEDGTVRAANSHLRAHIIPKLGALRLPEVNTKIVQAFVTYLASRGLSRKYVENILLTLSSILSKARAWGYACGSFSLADLTLPREGVKQEQRSFTASEAGRIVAAAKEPFKTLWAILFILGLRIGEGIGLRVCDLDFERKIIRVRQSVDSATRKIKACKSDSSSADLPMPPQLEARLRSYLGSEHFRPNNAGLDGQPLLFVNKRGRPHSANKLREKHLHPLLKRLGIPHGGFHAGRHGATSSMLDGGASPSVVQKQMRHSDARITLGIYGHVVGDAQRRAVETHAERIEAGGL